MKGGQTLVELMGLIYDYIKALPFEQPVPAPVYQVIVRLVRGDLIEVLSRIIIDHAPQAERPSSYSSVSLWAPYLCAPRR